MNFYSVLQDNENKLNTVYDLACLCYEHLDMTIDSHTQFLGEYILENEEADICNDNLKSLHAFSATVQEILEKQEMQGVSFEMCLKILVEKVMHETTNLIDFGNKSWNDATIPYFLLQAIDRYVIIKNGRCTERGPLNKSYMDKYYIYLNIGQSIIDDAAEKLRFSDIPESLIIRNQLRHLVILEKNKLPEKVNPPLLVSLVIDDADSIRKKIEQGKEWKVAIIPFANETSITFPSVSGAFFRVQYEKECLEKETERAVNLLDKAIATGANIVVFPEYVCCPEMQEAIREHLQKLYQSDRRKVGKLFLVIAGSGWDKEDNNIAYLYSYSGRELGRQYKYAVYHDVQNAAGDMVENLRTPGKEVTIVSIEGIGKCMTGICRDISDITYDKKYIPILAEIFAPMFLLIPAWTSSVNIGFKGQLKNITQNNHRTCSMLCNCCNAFGTWDKKERKFKKESDVFREELAIAVTPYKDGSMIIGKDKILKRRKEKCDVECERGGCFYLVNMNFEKDAVEKGRIIKSILPKYV